MDDGGNIRSDVLEKPMPSGEWRIPKKGLGTDQEMVASRRLLRFAIATARTTPVFLDSFTSLQQYWTEEPRRNIYHPGPSIVFIGRRGWSCLKLEGRDAIGFHLGVVETVLFSLQAIIASFRATRRFVEQIKTRGDIAGLQINKQLAKMGDLDPETLRKFTSFLARARLNATNEDMSALVRSYLTTHTGIACVNRIKRLLDYDCQIDNARNTLSNYAASLQGASNELQKQQLTELRKTSNMQFWAVVLAVCTLVAGLFGGFLGF